MFSPTKVHSNEGIDQDVITSALSLSLNGETTTQYTMTRLLHATMYYTNKSWKENGTEPLGLIYTLLPRYRCKFEDLDGRYQGQKEAFTTTVLYGRLHKKPYVPYAGKEKAAPNIIDFLMFHTTRHIINWCRFLYSSQRLLLLCKRP